MIKKIACVIVGVLLFLPVLVKADMGAPIIIEKEYFATPKSQSGATIYKYINEKENYVKTNEKLPYGYIVKVGGEYDLDTANFEKHDYDEYILVDEDEDDARYVKLMDLVPIEKTYKIKDSELGEPVSVIVLKKQEIKKGPANSYEGTGKFVEVGSKINVRYFTYYDEELKEYYNESDNPWVYVEYDGVQGFISQYTGQFAIYEYYTSAITLNDVNIINPSTGKKVATVKANTKFNTIVYTLDTWNDYPYYIEYGDVKGFVDSLVFQRKEELNFKLSEKMVVYEKLDYDDEGNNTSKIVTTLAKGTSFKSKYYQVDYDYATVYYENKGVSGWISADYHDYNVYNDEGELEAEEREMDEILGFKMPKKDEIVVLEKEKEPEVTAKDSPVEVVSGADLELIDRDGANKDVKKSNIRVPVLVYYCLGVAVIVSLTAVVTILLVNKKKKTNTEEVKEELKEETPITEEKQEEEKVDL